MQNKTVFKSNSCFRYLLYLFLLLPVFIFRDFTPPNELKYISIVEEALKNHTWFTFYNHGKIYADKPPLFFWLLMLVRQLTGGYPMWILGLFSLIPAIGILIIMDRWMEITGTRHNPIVSNLLLLTTTMFTGASLVLRMDMLMTFFIVLSLYTFFRIYKNKHIKIEEKLLPIYIFLAVFSKGPIGFLAPFVSIFTFFLIKREFRTLKRCWGWKQWRILLGLCAVWFFGIYMEGGIEYLNNILFKQTIGRGINSFHHKQPVWYYFPRLLWSFSPWILFYITVIWQGFRQKTHLSDMEKFFMTIIASNILMMSLVSSKLDIYLLPVYPFVTYLCSSLFHKISISKGMEIGIGLPGIIFILVFPVFIISKKYIPYDYSGILPYLGTGVLSTGGIFTILILLKKQLKKAIISLSFSLLIAIFIFSFMIPQFNQYIGFRELAESTIEKATEERIENYTYYRFYTAANIDVYLNHSIEYVGSVEQLDSLEHLPYKTILFVKMNNIQKEKEFENWVSTRQEQWCNNKYRWYVIGGNHNQ